MIPKSHYLDLVDGRFAGSTPRDLEALFQAVVTSATPDHLAVYIHGGLVPHASGQAAATALLPAFQGAGAYPTFFFWNSGPISTLVHNLDEVGKERVFHRLVLRLLQLVGGKLLEAGLPTTTARGTTLELESLKDMPRDLERLQAWATAREPPLARPSTLTESAALTAAQRAQIRQQLETDHVLQHEAQAIAAGLRPAAEIEAEETTRARGGPVVRVSTQTLMSPAILKEIAAEAPDTGTRSIGVITALARYGVEVVAAVASRYANGRAHGMLATVIEEIWRALYADSVGSVFWTLMKKDTADAFRGDPLVHGGTAFVERLAVWWKPGRRVTLIGHSTGAIFITHLLEAVHAALPAEAQLDVVFLAPAASFDFLHQHLPVLEKRVGGFRLFGLRDGLESGYWEVPVLYPASLLYLVSGLCEDPVVDMPIVGMQRYHSDAWPYQLPEIADVRQWIDGRSVWSLAADGPGRASGATRHGGFAADPQSLASLQRILAHGFGG